MKKMIVMAALVALAPFAQADKDAGCGLGSMLMEGQKGIVFKVLAATTNGTFGNQTFGMTSGTLGCSGDGVVTAANRLPMFAGTNLDQLATEMAAGQGEALTTLAALYNVQQQDIAHFAQVAQQNYASIITTDATAGDVLARLEAVMKTDARLAAYAA